MHKFFRLSIIICLSLSSLQLYAASQTISTAEKNAVNRAMEKLSKEAGKKLPVTDIKPSPIPGLLQVTSDLNVFYVTTDGQYLIAGELINPSLDKNSWSLTEQEMRKLRVKALADVNEKDMIIFPATNKKTIGTVTVFTDLDCPYCHKMQEHINEYTDAGITVRYLSFPRSGPKTQSFDEAVKIWCARDRNKAYTAAVETKEYPKDSCKNNPVMMEYELGQKMGVAGTPTIFIDNGVRVGGLVDAKTLTKIITDSRKS